MRQKSRTHESTPAVKCSVTYFDFQFDRIAHERVIEPSGKVSMRKTLVPKE
jgi:hypothetical protein